MRRILFLFAVSCLLCASVLLFGPLVSTSEAQTTAVTGTVKDTNGVPYAGATLKAQLVLAGGGATGQATVTVTGVQACRSSGFGSSPCQVPFQGTNGPITLDSTGSFSLVLQDNALVTPASTQWLFTVTSNGSPPPLGTGPQTCTATITITGASQSVSGNFSCPALSAVTAGSSPKGATDAGASTILLSDPKYNFPGISQWTCQAGITNGSNIVTSQANDRPFTGNPARNAAVGDFVWIASAQCGGENSVPVPILLLNAPGFTTITSIDSAHQIHIGANANASCTIVAQDGCILVWGPLAQASVNAAWTDAGNACGTLDLSVGGGIMLNAPPINTTAVCPGPAAGNDVGSGLTVKGAGPYATMILMRPDTTFGNVMFADPLGGQRRSFHDFGIASFSPAPAGAPPGGAQGANGFAVFFNSHFYNVWFLNYFPSTSVNFTGLAASGVANAVTEVENNVFTNVGQHAVSLTTQVYFHHNQIQNTNNCISYVGSGSPPGYMHHNVVALCGTQGAFNWGSSSGALFSDDDFFNGVGTTLPAFNVASATASVLFKNIVMGASQTTGATLNIVAGASVTIEGPLSSIGAQAGTAAAIINAGTLALRQTTAFSSGGVSLNNSGTVIIKDGTVFSNGITNTGTLQVVEGMGGHNGGCTGTVATGNNGLNLNSVACAASVGGVVMGKSGTVYAIQCTASAAGNQAADACTLFKNGAAQALTCSLNGVTTCTDGAAAHAVAYVASDRLQVVAVGGAATTLANPVGVMVAP